MAKVPTRPLTGEATNRVATRVKGLAPSELSSLHLPVGIVNTSYPQAPPVHLTYHAIVRWAERARGVDVESLRQAIGEAMTAEEGSR